MDPLSYTFPVTSLGLPLESIAVLIALTGSPECSVLMNVDVDVSIGLLVASKLGELDRDVYTKKKTVTTKTAAYTQSFSLKTSFINTEDLRHTLDMPGVLFQSFMI